MSRTGGHRNIWDISAHHGSAQPQMPMELVGAEFLDFDAAQYTVTQLRRFLPLFSLPQDTGVWMIMTAITFSTQLVDMLG